MSSFQSKLDSEAEKLAEGQRSISISEFFEKNKQMLGFDSKSKGIVTAVKEAVDNSLDAAEEAGYLPNIRVEIQKEDEYYRLIVEDNGPGITEKQIPKVFGKLLYGSRFHKRVQSRGQQGIGISAAVMYGQLTSGKPARIKSKTNSNGKARYFELRIDTDKNEPQIQEKKTVEWEEKEHGTRITIDLDANMRARKQLHDYIQQTAVVNPHARVEFNEPKLDEPIVYDRVTDELPDETEEIQPHPHGVNLGTLQEMLEVTNSHNISGFLQSEFTRVGQKTANNIIDNFRDRYYGREMAWEVTCDEDELVNEVKKVVNNKGKDATHDFVTRIYQNLNEKQYVTYGDVKETVIQVSEEVSNNFGMLFGSTVREKATRRTWDVITKKVSLGQLVDEATSKRKDDSAVQEFSEKVVQEILQRGDERHRITYSQLREIIDEVADSITEESFGETSRDKIFEAVWERMETVSDVPPKVKNVRSERDAVGALRDGMQATKVISPPSSCLSPIKEENIKKGLKKVFDANFYSASTRDADSHSGEPFIAEAGIAYGGELSEGQADVLRFANRVPLVYQRGACATTDVIKQIGWRNYSLSQSGGHGIPDGPVVILVHVASTNVPFTSQSKDAVANVEIIETEVERAIRGAARELKKHLKKKKSLRERRERQNVVARVLPEISKKAASVVGEEPADVTSSMARITNSVLVEKGEESLSFRNYSDVKSFRIRLLFEDEKPTYPSKNVEREETENGWQLVWDNSIEQGSSDEITWNGEQPSEIEFDEIVDEKITIVNGGVNND